MAAEFAPKPGSGVRPLFHYYRQLRPMPAREALEMARYHARMFDESDLFEPRTAGVSVLEHQSKTPTPTDNEHPVK